MTQLTKTKQLLALIGLASSLQFSCSHKTQVSSPVASTNKMDWWEKARFGMFIHWGVYAVPAGIYHGQAVNGYGEWIQNDAKIPCAEYQQFAQQFIPDQYDAEKWVQMAEDAGMKYIVITAKHHDGFALFDTKASNWSIMKASPWGKDLLQPLVDACRRHNMKIGFYYSQANDWNNPGGAEQYGKWDDYQNGSMDDYIDKVAVPQVRELLTKYGDVAELWWDVPTDMTPERAAKLDAVLKLQPNVITNDRLGGGYNGDFTTPEQYIPGTGMGDRHWETCMTMNGTWGYKLLDNDWKSPEDLLHNLIDISSKGGNYLLNIGPKANGEIPSQIVDRLQSVGNWMKVYGEAIYGTTASPFKTLSWGRCTKKVTTTGTTLYLHVFSWPLNGTLFVPGLRNAVTSAVLMGDNKKLSVGVVANGVNISVPAYPANDIASVIRVETTGTLDVEVLPIEAGTDGSYQLTADLADLHDETGDGDIAVEGGSEPNVGYWTDKNDWISWNVHVSKAGVYTVKATVASESDGSAFSVIAGSSTLSGVAPNTNDYGNYAEIELGTISITETGTVLIKMKPDVSSWSPVNLRKLVLVP